MRKALFTLLLSFLALFGIAESAAALTAEPTAPQVPIQAAVQEPATPPPEVMEQVTRLEAGPPAPTKLRVGTAPRLGERTAVIPPVWNTWVYARSGNCAFKVRLYATDHLQIIPTNWSCTYISVRLACYFTSEWCSPLIKRTNPPKDQSIIAYA